MIPSKYFRTLLRLGTTDTRWIRTFVKSGDLNILKSRNYPVQKSIKNMLSLNRGSLEERIKIDQKVHWISQVVTKSPHSCYNIYLFNLCPKILFLCRFQNVISTFMFATAIFTWQLSCGLRLNFFTDYLLGDTNPCRKYIWENHLKAAIIKPRSYPFLKNE